MNLPIGLQCPTGQSFDGSCNCKCTDTTQTTCGTKCVGIGLSDLASARLNGQCLSRCLAVPCRPVLRLGILHHLPRRRRFLHFRRAMLQRRPRSLLLQATRRNDRPMHGPALHNGRHAHGQVRALPQELRKQLGQACCLPSLLPYVWTARLFERQRRRFFGTRRWKVPRDQ